MTKRSKKTLSLADAEAIRAFHRPIWEVMREGYLVTEHDRSIRSLREQGYTLDDISLMFGVSRERTRQWCIRAGCDPKHSTGHRIWDDALNQFRSVTRKEHTEHKRERTNWRPRRARSLARRAEVIAHLRVMTKDLERLPTQREWVESYLGKSYPIQQIPMRLYTILAGLTLVGSSITSDSWTVVVKSAYFAAGVPYPERGYRGHKANRAHVTLT